MPTLPITHDAAAKALRTGKLAVVQLGPGWLPHKDCTGTGTFLRMQVAEPAAYIEQVLGNVVGLARFTSIYRFSPFWTRPATGSDEAAVKPETAWLLAETTAGLYVMLVPLIDASCRYSLRAAGDKLAVAAETGDSAIPCAGGVALFVAAADDPYALVEAGARAVVRHLGSGALRSDRPLPDFIDLFGWCTWDAFYKDVSPDKVLQGLDSLARAGVSPKLLILDDGWQEWERGSGGEDCLVSLQPNAKFNGDLSPLAREAKQRYGIERFLVWHALLGYWGGLSAKAFARYEVTSVARSFGPGLLEQEPRWNEEPWGTQLGVPAADQFAAFYEDLHRSLAAQGVDGVKVDAQALLEAVSSGQGGRVALARASRRALEASAARHFDRRLINCMSCSPECLYLSQDSSILRTSDDFFPERPASHGLHLYVNAMAGVWFGEFMQPDWDMFQSAHPRGAFHAAARAVSGGPVYVSDGIGQHDAAVLRKLVLSDGTVLRADLPGRPTPDCLFVDPTREPALLKVFNRNRDSAIVGLFNVGELAQAIAGTVTPSDVPGLPRDRAFAAWAHRMDRLWHCVGARAPDISLAQGEWELVSLAPVERGFAAIGLADKFNSTGAIVSRLWDEGGVTITLRDGGSFLAWAEECPLAILCDGQAVAFNYDPATSALTAALPTGGRRVVRIAIRQ